MPTIECPQCGAGDEALTGRRERSDTPEGTVIVHCSRSGADFPRAPDVSCPRCGPIRVHRTPDRREGRRCLWTAGRGSDVFAMVGAWQARG